MCRRFWWTSGSKIKSWKKKIFIEIRGISGAFKSVMMTDIGDWTKKKQKPKAQIDEEKIVEVS